jgi:hypothetical protein
LYYFSDRFPCFLLGPDWITPDADEDIEQQEFFLLLMGMKIGTDPLENSSMASYKTKPYYLSFTLHHVCPKEIKTYTHTKTCTKIFAVVLFIVAKTYKQTRCLSVGK